MLPGAILLSLEQLRLREAEVGEIGVGRFSVANGPFPTQNRSNKTKLATTKNPQFLVIIN